MTNEQNLDILCLCETFLNKEFSDNELIIPDYNSIRKDRQTHGGGLIVYTRSNLAYCIHRDDLEIQDTEMLWLKVKNNKQKSFLLCYCYRPSSTSNVWIENFEEAIECANLEAKEVIVIGDFNFNLLNETGSSKQWLRLTDSLNFNTISEKAN